jgi:hypothetical protein
VRVALVCGVALALAGCNEPSAKEPPVPLPANSEFGRWAVVPASSGITLGGNPYLMAWRLDTKSGDLEMCIYDPGDFSLTKKIPIPASLSCTPAARAFPSN